MAETPRSLIINTPYLKPEQHWGDPRNDGSLPIVTERRKAGYEIFGTRNQTWRFVELKQVNKIRKRVDDWRGVGQPLPPVMLTVCNRTETSARVEHYFNKGDCHFQEMHAPQKTLRVDSRILEKAELGGKAGADKDYEARLREIIAAADIQDIKKQALVELKKEEQLRAIVDNVGKRSQAGQDIQNVISVAMLSEGWDAKNVTHIMGLRAFTSQLLCEQVIGRGLRRVAYEREFRLQSLVFRAARNTLNGLQGAHFNGDRDYLALQLIQVVEQFLASDKIVIPSLFHQEDVRKRVLLSLNIDLIVQHLARHIEQQNLERIEPIFDSEFPLGSTENMRTWYTTKPNHPTVKSQICPVVFDSSWEAAKSIPSSPMASL